MRPCCVVLVLHRCTSIAIRTSNMNPLLNEGILKENYITIPLYPIVVDYTS